MVETFVSLMDQVLTAEVVQVPLNALFAMQQSNQSRSDCTLGSTSLLGNVVPTPMAFVGGATSAQWVWRLPRKQRSQHQTAYTLWSLQSNLLELFQTRLHVRTDLWDALLDKVCQRGLLRDRKPLDFSFTYSCPFYVLFFHWCCFCR